MKFFFSLCVLLVLMTSAVRSQHKLAPGEQPQLAVDANETVRLVFGRGEEIFYSVSGDKGQTFSEPVAVAHVKGMHLGMTRGPQLASSKDYSVMTAMDKEGNIHSFRLTHASGKWEKLHLINDTSGSAPEGLMSIAADDQNNFFAVWLDLRKGRKNNICFSTLRGQVWSRNMFAYTSPESHVCECCKPSIAVRGRHVVIMFRNWLNGSRDLYTVSSTDAGKNFGQAEKLGTGTWLLKGCPMDGGGLAIDTQDHVHTVWQRDGQVFYAQPGQLEQKIGDGRGVGLNDHMAAWQSGSDLIVHRINGYTKKIGTGTAPEVHEFSDQRLLVVWEADDEIIYEIL